MRERFPFVALLGLSFHDWVFHGSSFRKGSFRPPVCLKMNLACTILCVETSGCDGGMRCIINVDTMEVLRHQTQQKQTNLKLSPKVWGSHCNLHYYCSQFSSVAQLCLILWDPMDCSTPGLPVHHQPPELAQTHVHWVGDSIQPSHPLSSPSPPTFKYDENTQSWHTPFPIWNKSIAPCPVLTVASWPPYRFLRRQVRWSGIPLF